MRAILMDVADTDRIRRSTLAVFFLMLGAIALVGWSLGSSNPFTPAGYVGYLTKGAVMGHSRFYGIQRGPTSPGRTWLLDVTNVSITPYTYTDDFSHDDAVLSRDNLKVAFQIHTVWHVDETKVPLFMDRFSTTVGREALEKSPDAIVTTAYGNFIREPLRTFARDGARAHPTLCGGQSVPDQQRRGRQRPVPRRGGKRGVTQAGRHSGTPAQGH
jgi:hypothetical protein